MDGRRMRRRLAAAIGGTALAGLAVGVVLALAGGFEYRDGDTAGGADWDAVYAGTAAVDATSFTADNDYWGELTLFTGGGSKDINDVSMWAWRTVGQPPDKTDLLHAMAAYDASAGSGGTPQLYFAADRYATNGDAKVGFWFFQNEIALNTATYRFDGTHSSGDILVEATFTKGGRVDTINVYRWTGSGLSTAGVDGGDCEDAGYAGYDVCATVNDAEIDPAWTYAGKFSGGLIAKGGFIEGALDLTALFGSNVPCFSSFLAETRSAGSSITSELKDFVLGDFDTCADITIRKVRAGGTSGDTFDFTTGGLTPSTFSLTGATSDGTIGAANQRTFSNVLPGTYTVRETVPAGWVLTGLACTGGVTATDGSLVTITADAGDDIVCTYTDGRTPTIEVRKTIVPADDPGRFNLLVDGTVVKANASSGDTSGPLERAPGTYVVSEDTNGTGTDITAYTTAYSCTNGSSGSGTSVSVTLAYGDAVTCTFTNTRIPPTTRTQGFWQTHPTLAAAAWGASQSIGGCRTVATSASAGQDQLMGGFWASISYKSTGQRRSPIDQARMTLIQQLLAAKLNYYQFGSMPTGSISIADAEAAFCGSSMSAIKQAAQAMGAFNEGGSSAPWSPGMSADPGAAQLRANVAYWNALP
ncbi:MAG: hypothetical protein RL338_213 [Chloroflexota bacterium]